MNDLISRKAVFYALECMRFASDEERRYAFSMVEQIPTAEPEVPDINVGDMISRQDAIDALNEYFVRIGKLKRRGLTKGEKAISLDTVGVIKTLPSAQPEVETQMSLADCISRKDALSCFHDWIDSHGDVHTADEMPEYQRINKLPSAQPEMRHCVNCGRTINNGGWYKDGGTRCPIEEHYALPKDGFCHLWEKRNVTDDDYPERRKE